MTKEQEIKRDAEIIILEHAVVWDCSAEDALRHASITLNHIIAALAEDDMGSDEVMERYEMIKEEVSSRKIVGV